MSDDVNEALGLASASTEQKRAGTPTEQVLQEILTESRKQTRHLLVIRWMLAFAWLMLLIGGIRIIVR